MAYLDYRSFDAVVDVAELMRAFTGRLLTQVEERIDVITKFVEDCK